MGASCSGEENQQVPTFISRVRVSDEHWDGGVGFAMFEIDPTFANKLLHLMVKAEAVAKAHNMPLSDMAFFDSSVWWLPWSSDVDNADEIGDSEEPRLIKEKIYDLKQKDVRTEVDELHVDDRRVWWTAWIKHTSVRVSSMSVTKETLEKIERGEL